jgi:hypothetical protein
MLSLLVQPTTLLIRKHLALAGLNVNKSQVIQAPGLDSENYVDKFIEGKDTVGLLYERGKLKKSSLSSKPIRVHLVTPEGQSVMREAISCIVPFNFAVISNQILDLDNYELLHSLKLATTTFGFDIVVPELVEQDVNYLQYSMSYVRLDEKSNEKLEIRALKQGFHEYKFAVNVEGWLLAPYTTDLEITTNVVFELKLGDLQKGQTAFIEYIPENTAP